MQHQKYEAADREQSNEHIEPALVSLRNFYNRNEAF